MKLLLAQPKHLEEICKITQQAKISLNEMGLDQWQKGYPSKEIWENDIRNQSAWIAVKDDVVLGAFAYQNTPDPSYACIQGAWLTERPYASMHRVCVSSTVKGKGIAGKMFAFGFELARQQGFSSMRIDTHPDNLPMRRALEKAGFLHCGTIILIGGCENGDPRVAYEKLL